MDGVPMEQLEVRALKEAFGELPKHIKIMKADTPINTYSLFKGIDYGVTVRGTIGMELPCYGLPVVTAGTGRYSNRGFTIDPRTVDEYRHVLSTLQDQAPLDHTTVVAAQRYASATLFRKCWKISGVEIDFNQMNAPISSLRVNTRIIENDPDVLLGPDCLGSVAAWIDGEEADYFGGQFNTPTHQQESH